jgi:hypothetical protein
MVFLPPSGVRWWALSVTSTSVPTNSMTSRIHNGRDRSVSSSNRIRYRRPSDA